MQITQKVPHYFGETFSLEYWRPSTSRNYVGVGYVYNDIRKKHKDGSLRRVQFNKTVNLNNLQEGSVVPSPTEEGYRLIRLGVRWPESSTEQQRLVEEAEQAAHVAKEALQATEAQLAQTTEQLQKQEEEARKETFVQLGQRW